MLRLSERKAIYKKALEKFGRPMQLLVAVEEMAELTKEISKFQRSTQESGYNIYNMFEEIADVKIMIEQLEMIFNCKHEVDSIQYRKVSRLRELVRNGK